VVTPAPDPQVPHYSSIIQQMPVYSILLMIHGGLVLLLALGLAVLAAVIPFGISLEGGADGAGIDDEERMMLYFMTFGYGLAAAGTGAIALVQFWAGWRGFRFRNRILGFCGVGAAFLCSLSCYCAPTGISLGIWGLILLLNPDIQHAFELARGGMSRQQIMRFFSGTPTATDAPSTSPSSF
jgi:hypothetical protein